VQYLEDNKLTVLLNTEESIFLWIGSEILSEKQMNKGKKSRQRTARNSEVGDKS